MTKDLLELKNISKYFPGVKALDGVSLTLGPQIGRRSFEVYLIPHTLEVTTLGSKKAGDWVNLETDILGKYVLRYLGSEDGASLSMDRLRRAGFSADARSDSGA